MLFPLFVALQCCVALPLARLKAPKRKAPLQTRKLLQNYDYACSFNTDCADSYHVCDGGECVGNFAAGCDADFPCSYDLVCLEGYCGYDVGDFCTESTECGGLYQCSKGFCAPNYQVDCSSDSNCTSSLVCGSEKKCASEIGGLCNEDGDCFSDALCQDGICESPSQVTPDLLPSPPMPIEVQSPMLVIASPSPTPVVIPLPSPTPVIFPSPSPTPVISLASPPPPTKARPPPQGTNSADSTSSDTPDSILPSSSESDGSSIPIGVIVGASVGGAVLLFGVVALIAASRFQAANTAMAKIPWPPREFAGPKAEYVKFWKGCKWERAFSPSHTHVVKLDPHPGVYEFGLVHPARPHHPPVVVYIGKAGGAGGLKKRHDKYHSTGGDHLQAQIALALNHNCEVWRRVKYAKGAQGGAEGMGDRIVTQEETRFLSFYDYAWNKEANMTKRAVYLKPRRYLCCFPAGESIHNDTAVSPFPHQVPPPCLCFCVPT